MPALAAAIVTAFGWAMKFLIARAILAVGLQIVVVAGYDVMLDWIIAQAFDALNALDGQIYAIVYKVRIPDAIAIIGAAHTVKASFIYGAGKLMLAPRITA